MHDSYLRFPDVFQRVKLSRPTIWRKEREGTFPPRRQISGNSVGWLESEIDEWIASRASVHGMNKGAQ